MKHFIQFDENGEIQFVVKAEFDAQVAKEQKNKLIEVSEAEAQKIKKPKRLARQVFFQGLIHANFYPLNELVITPQL